MTEQGPVIANLELRGILPKDVVTEDMARVNQVLAEGGYIHSGGIASAEQTFTGGRA